MKTYQNFISEEILVKCINFEIFNYPNLNKGYVKLNKYCLIIFILLRFIIDDFNFDNNLKNNLKKIFSAINDILIGILDNFIFPFINSTLNNNTNNNTNQNSNTIYHIEKFKENVHKYLLQTQTRNANRKQKNKRDLFITIVKNCDAAILVFKNFSK